MKKLRMLVGAVALAVPAMSQAQLPVDATVDVTIGTNSTYQTGAWGYEGTGGGFFASFTVNFPSPVGDRSFTDYLIWCIDPGRSVQPPTTISYQLYKLTDFAATSYGSITGHDPDLADMTRIASLQNAMYTTWGQPGSDSWQYQGAIWSWWDGYTKYGNKDQNADGVSYPVPMLQGDPNFNVSDYYVLWNGSNQTFITRLPEPGSNALMMVALGGLALVVARRRRSA